jgi:hypothetical protein
MKQPAAGDQDGCKLTMGTHPQDRLPVVSNSNIVFASRQMKKKKKKKKMCRHLGQNTVLPLRFCVPL